MGVFSVVRFLTPYSIVAQKAGNVSTSPIIGQSSKVCTWSSSLFAQPIFEYLRFRKSPVWYDASQTSDVKSMIGAIHSSTGLALAIEFVIVSSERVDSLLCHVTML